MFNLILTQISHEIKVLSSWNSIFLCVCLCAQLGWVLHTCQAVGGLEFAQFSVGLDICPTQTLGFVCPKLFLYVLECIAGSRFLS